MERYAGVVAERALTPSKNCSPATRFLRSAAGQALYGPSGRSTESPPSETQPRSEGKSHRRSPSGTEKGLARVFLKGCFAAVAERAVAWDIATHHKSRGSQLRRTSTSSRNHPTRLGGTPETRESGRGLIYHITDLFNESPPFSP
jgi:hypothetical protein